MAKEKPESELKRLRTEQSKVRQDEVFGGLSPAERAVYNAKADRINQLEIELTASSLRNKSSQSAKAEESRQWSKDPETDTPQAEPRQSYRSREQELTDNSTASRRKRNKGKNAPREKGELS